MPLLPRAHDCHRDLRARLPTQTPSNSRIARDQDRYLMTASQPIEDATDTHRFHWLAARSHRTCNESSDSHFLATSISASSMQTATSQTHPHQTVAIKQ